MENIGFPIQGQVSSQALLPVSVLCKDMREKAERDCPEVVGLAAKWTAQILLDEFSTHVADNADAPSALRTLQTAAPTRRESPGPGR